MLNARKALTLIAVGVAATVFLTGCTPRAGGKCDPSKDSSYLSSHTDNGKTVTTRLECKQVGVDRYEWVKV